MQPQTKQLTLTKGLTSGSGVCVWSVYVCVCVGVECVCVWSVYVCVCRCGVCVCVCGGCMENE